MIVDSGPIKTPLRSSALDLEAYLAKGRKATAPPRRLNGGKVFLWGLILAEVVILFLLVYAGDMALNEADAVPLDRDPTWSVSRVRELRELREFKSVADAVAASKGPAGLIPIVIENRGSVPARIVSCIIFRESRWNPRAIGKQGEVGLMQIKETTAKTPAKALLNPATNVRIGCALLQSLYEKYGEWGMAIAAYAGGENAGNILYAENILKEAGL